MTVKYLKLLWYRFLSTKTEIARFAVGFRLNIFTWLRGKNQSSLDTPYSGKLRHGSVVTFLENVKGGGGWCTFLGFVHNGINS